MFNTDPVILGRIALVLNTPVDQINPDWSVIVAETHGNAYQIILEKLMGKGWLKSQIDNWDRGANVESDLALYLALVRGGQWENYSTEYLDRISYTDAANRSDPGRNLRNLETLSVSGVWTKPGDTDAMPGLVSYGAFAEDGMFGVPTDPEDSRIGEPMRF